MSARSRERDVECYHERGPSWQDGTADFMALLALAVLMVDKCARTVTHLPCFIAPVDVSTIDDAGASQVDPRRPRRPRTGSDQDLVVLEFRVRYTSLVCGCGSRCQAGVSRTIEA